MKNKLAAAAISVTLITFFSKLVGFFRDVVLASAYGTSMEADGFLLAQNITSLMSVMLLVALNTSYVPVYADILRTENPRARNQFVNVCNTFFVLIGVCITVIALLVPDGIVYLFAPKFSVGAHDLSVQMLRILAVTMCLNTVMVLNNARLQSHGHYNLSAMISFPLNLGMIGYMVSPLNTQYGIWGLGVVYTIGIGLQIVLQFPGIRGLQNRFGLNFNFNHPGLKKIGFLVLPILFGSLLQQINFYVDRVLASGLPNGSIAAMNYAYMLILFVVGLLSAAVGSVFYTTMAGFGAQGQMAEFKSLLITTTKIMWVIIVPATVGIIVLHKPLVSALYERGAFGATATATTASALMFYAIGLIGYSLRDVFTRALYALKDSKIAMYNGIFAVVVNVTISLMLVPTMGVAGLAIGTSISGLVSTALLALSLRRKVVEFGSAATRSDYKLFGLALIFSALMGVCVHLAYFKLVSWGIHQLLSLSVAVLVGVLLYSALMLLSDRSLLNWLKERR